jgi:hypothetical protein
VLLHMQAAILNHFLDKEGLSAAEELVHRCPEAIRTLPIYEGVLGLVAQVLRGFRRNCTRAAMIGPLCNDASVDMSVIIPCILGFTTVLHVQGLVDLHRAGQEC